MLNESDPLIMVYRTASHDDALISPFLLDPSSITLLTKHSHHRYQGMWLHMSVMVNLINTREQTLHHVNYLSSLRHPNLEQFLGAVVDRHSQKAIITEFVQGKTLSQLLHRRCLAESVALTIALDVARALVYLHVKTGVPHGWVRPESVVYDHARGRAVLLLSTRIRSGRWETRDKLGGMERDVYSVAVLVLLMFEAIHNIDACVEAEFVHLLPRPLRRVVWCALQDDVRLRPSIEQLCQALTDCQT